MNQTEIFGQVELDSEAMVLSCMINSEKVALAVCDIIDEDYFYKKAHQEIFKAVKLTLDDGKLKNQLLSQGEIYDRVEDKDSCNKEYFLKISDYVLVAIYPEEYLEVIINSRMRRLLIEKNNEIVKNMNGRSDVQDVIEQIEDNMEECKSKLKLCKGDSLKEQSAGVTVKALMEKSSKSEGKLIRKVLKTGFLSLDTKAFLEKGEVTFLGGRPGMGKSSGALAITQSMAKLGHKILYIFHESSKEKLIVKALCQIYNQTETEIRDHFYDYIIKNESYHLTSENFLIVPEVRTYTDLKRKIRELKNKKFLPDVIIIDQVTKMTNPDAKSNLRTYELESINNLLEEIARGENKDESDQIAILGLAQMNRGKESEDWPYPSLENLRDSGSFEQSASTVVLMFRPFYYWPSKNHKKGYLSQMEALSTKWGCSEQAEDLLIMNFAKCRYGSNSEVAMKFNLPGTGITEWGSQGIVI